MRGSQFPHLGKGGWLGEEGKMVSAQLAMKTEVRHGVLSQNAKLKKPRDSLTTFSMRPHDGNQGPFCLYDIYKMKQ